MTREDKARELERETHLIIYNPWVMLGGQSVFVLIVVLIYFFFKPVVPQFDMQLWSAIAGSILIFVIIFNAAFFLRRPIGDELLRFRRIDKKLTIAFDAIAVTMILVLLPHGGEEHKLITVTFCVGYVPLQMISDPENVFGNKFSIVVVLGTFIFYLLQQGQTAEVLLAALMVLYGATLYFSSAAFRDVVLSALTARRETERANAALSAALAEVSAARDAKTRFISTASHDLGQPLHAAKLFSEQLAASQDKAARDRATKGLVSAVASAQAMLSHMLNHLRLEADAVTPHRLPVELGDSLDRLIDQFAAEAEARHLAIRAIATRLTIETDPVLLDRAIGNLLQNAITHSGAKRLFLGARRRRDWVDIWVIDDGIGIAPGDVPTLFEDYSQGSNSRSPTKAGFGLGLSSVQRLARLLGGEVRFEPRWRNGSAFCISLPIAARLST